MNTQEIAQNLLQRRNAMNPVIMPGEMLGSIGADAVQEALQRRWLVPNQDTGLLQVSAEMSKVNEMRAIAGEQKPDAAPTLESHERNLAIGHASRHPNYLHELLSPATGHDPNAAMPVAPAAAPAPTAPAPARPPTSPVGQRPAAGDMVTVSEDGKVYTGKVDSTQGGRYRVTFGGTEKPRTNRDYNDTEVQKVQPSQSAAPR